MKYQEISEAYRRLQNLKAKFRYIQINTENIKKRIYDHYETELDRWQWEMLNQYEILNNRYALKIFANEIKEVRKLIKKLNRKQNIKEHQ